MLTPYPGHLDSAAAYLTMMAWYLKQEGCSCMMFNQAIDGIGVSLNITGIFQSFNGPSPQDCLRQLHAWVCAQQQAAGVAITEDAYVQADLRGV